MEPESNPKPAIEPENRFTMRMLDSKLSHLEHKSLSQEVKTRLSVIEKHLGSPGKDGKDLFEYVEPGLQHLERLSSHEHVVRPILMAMDLQYNRYSIMRIRSTTTFKSPKSEEKLDKGAIVIPIGNMEGSSRISGRPLQVGQFYYIEDSITVSPKVDLLWIFV